MKMAIVILLITGCAAPAPYGIDCAIVSNSRGEFLGCATGSPGVKTVK
jgi:hypothetical protein